MTMRGTMRGRSGRNDCDISHGDHRGRRRTALDQVVGQPALVYNTIDDMKNPHAGIYATVDSGSCRPRRRCRIRQVHRPGHATTIRFPKNWTSSACSSGGGGHIAGYGDDGLRIFDQFQSNDRMIRGFEYGGIGPYDAARRRRSPRRHDLFQCVGGSSVPGAGHSGELWSAWRGVCRCRDALRQRDQRRRRDIARRLSMEWRASVGAGLIWASPFGPLRVDYASRSRKKSSTRCRNSTSASRPASDASGNDASGPLRSGRIDPT